MILPTAPLEERRGESKMCGEAKQPAKQPLHPMPLRGSPQFVSKLSCLTLSSLSAVPRGASVHAGSESQFGVGARVAILPANRLGFIVISNDQINGFRWAYMPKVMRLN